MCTRIVLAVVVSLATPGAQAHVGFRDGTAETLFNTARNAVGGEGAISGLTSLLIRGTVRSGETDGGPEVRDVEIRILLPDGILRIETAPDFEKRSGVSGPTLLTSIRSGGALETPPASLRGAMVTAERARLGRLMLGMAVMPVRPGWLTLRSARTAVTTVDPRTTTDDATRSGTALTADRVGQRVLEGAAQDGFFIRLFFDASSLPSRIQYEAGRGGQVTMEFSDRRRVSGLLLPYRILTASGGRIVEELIIREIVVNPRLTAADFER